MAAAHLVAPDWDYDKVEEEFTKFKDWNLDAGNTSANWDAAWKTWCHRGVDYERHHKTSELGGMASVMAGLDQALRRTKNRMKH